MLQIGIRLHDVNTQCPPALQTLEERTKAARKQGFSCVHLAPQKIMKNISFEGSVFTEGMGHYFKRVFDENKLDIAVLGCYMNLATPDQEKLKAFKQRYYGSIRVARICGAGMVGTETGAPNAAYQFDGNTHSKEALDIFIRNLADVVACGEKYGVAIAIEPVWKHIVYDEKRALEVIHSIQSPNLRIIFDPVNLLSYENADDGERVIGRAMDALSDHIAMVHIKDYVRKENDLKSVAAGEGEMDYRRIMQFLKDKKPYIQATLENTDSSNAVKAKALIERMYYEA